MNIIKNKLPDFILVALLLVLVAYSVTKNSHKINLTEYKKSSHSIRLEYNLNRLNYRLINLLNYAQIPKSNTNLSAVKPNNLINVKVNRKYGYVNDQGKMVIPAIFDSYAEFRGEFAKLRYNNKYGIINSQGEIVIPFKFDDIKSPISLDRGYLIANKNGKEGIIDHQGNTIVPFKFDRFLVYSRKSIIVKNEGEIGYVNRQHKFIPLTTQNK